MFSLLPFSSMLYWDCSDLIKIFGGLCDIFHCTLEPGMSTRELETVICQPTNKAGEKSLCKGFVCFPGFVSTHCLKEEFETYMSEIFFQKEHFFFNLYLT